MTTAGSCQDLPRCGIHVQIIDRCHGSGSAKDLEGYLFGVERLDVVRDTTGGRGGVVRAEDAVQPIDAESRDRHHRHGNQHHPAAFDQASH